MSSPKLIHERHIPVRGQHHTSPCEITLIHSVSIIENSAVHHFSGCGKCLWFSNTSKLLTISKDWMWHLLCQRQWIQCLALRLHVSKGIFVCLPWKKKKSDSVFIGKREIQQPSLKETSPVSLKLLQLNKAISRHAVTQARDFWGLTVKRTHPSPFFNYF